MPGAPKKALSRLHGRGLVEQWLHGDARNRFAPVGVTGCLACAMCMRAEGVYACKVINDEITINFPINVNRGEWGLAAGLQVSSNLDQHNSRHVH